MGESLGAFTALKGGATDDNLSFDHATRERKRGESMSQTASLAVTESSPSEVSICHAKAVELGKLILRMTTAAGSGHPSSALALIHVIVELMYRRMRYDPADPWNPSSDRLVLSEGHAVPVVYAAYADLGGAVGSLGNRKLLAVDQLTTLRELSSVLDGHPNPGEGFPFFDAATGSLGQGLSVGAGLALGARLDGIEKHVFVIIGDGESREGQIWEAADFIVDHKLTNVCATFSCNGWGQAAEVSWQQSSETIARKLTAFGWEVISVDGHDPAALARTFGRFLSPEKPLAVVAGTVKGWGVESIQRENYHGKPVSAGQLESACAELDATARRLGAGVGSVGSLRPGARKDSRTSDRDSRADATRAGETRTNKISIGSFEDALRRCGLAKAVTERKLATRAAYGVALVALGDTDQRIVALDGDVSNSTYANLFAKFHADRFFECKIAEQNMISVGVGLSAGGKIPFASSFAKFIARGTDQIDMATISRANLKIVGSHSGVSLAADGPSQMSLADVAYFRSMSRADLGGGWIACHVFHPSDAVSAYRCCELMANIEGMCYLRTHRPDAPFLYPLDETFELGGCKQLRNGKHLTLVSSGFMLHTVLRAADRLAKEGINCNVFDAYTFPLDAEPILAAAHASGMILAVEDNYVGGLHAELAEAAAQRGGLRVTGLTVTRMPKSARTADEVFAHCGVGLDQILAEAHRLAGR